MIEGETFDCTSVTFLAVSSFVRLSWPDMLTLLAECFPGICCTKTIHLRSKNKKHALSPLHAHTRNYLFPQREPNKRNRWYFHLQWTQGLWQSKALNIPLTCKCSPLLPLVTFWKDLSPSRSWIHPQSGLLRKHDKRSEFGRPPTSDLPRFTAPWSNVVEEIPDCLRGWSEDRSLGLLKLCWRPNCRNAQNLPKWKQEP